jgi:hypothetical protein
MAFSIALTTCSCEETEQKTFPRFTWLLFSSTEIHQRKSNAYASMKMHMQMCFPKKCLLLKSCKQNVELFPMPTAEHSQLVEDKIVQIGIKHTLNMPQNLFDSHMMQLKTRASRKMQSQNWSMQKIFQN